MSDKFFFKGRQDARQDHKGTGFQTNAALKPGTKKSPLNLVVVSVEREAEVQAQIDDAKLYANILLDKQEGASENIEELTGLLSKQESFVKEAIPLRNDPCSCKSGKKYKKCCGQ